jgi:hypothetical protein
VSGGCDEIFVALREGEPGCEAASELKRSSSSLAKADLRLPGGREGVMVAAEAMADEESSGCVGGREDERLFLYIPGRLNG